MKLKLGIFALVGFGILAYFTYHEAWLASKSSDKPEEIKIKDLIKRGASGNANIILTDFVLCGNFVMQQKSKNGSWTHVWIPAVPTDQADPDPKAPPPNPPDPKVLFFSTNITNPHELEAKLNRPKVSGMVTNGITTLEPKIRDLLKQSYPRADFDTCLIIQEGRTATSFGAIGAMGVASAALFFVGLGLLVWAYVSRNET